MAKKSGRKLKVRKAPEALTIRHQAHLQEQFHELARLGWIGKAAKLLEDIYAPTGQSPSLAEFDYRDVEKACRMLGCTKGELLSAPQH